MDIDCTRTRVTRRIVADPTGTALLLAGPTAIELWPGVRRIGDAHGSVLVEADLEPARRARSGRRARTGRRDPAGRRAAPATVRAEPPHRTPTSYVSRFRWAGPGLPGTTGVLTLAYAPAADGAPTTHAVLTLDSCDLADSRLSQRRLQLMAEQFLDNLGRAAEARSQAA